MAKSPYWLTEAEFLHVEELLSSESLHTAEATALRDEVGVARLRAKASRVSAPMMARVLGYGKTSVPLQLDENEALYLAGLDVPESLKEKLL